MDRQIKKKKWTPKRIAVLSLAAVFLVFALKVILFDTRDTKLNVNAERLSISTVNKGPFQEFIAVTGTLIPIKTIYLDAVEGGSVDSIYLEAGTFVNRGDSILKLANTNLMMDIMYREAELFQQSNNLRNTRLLMEQNRLRIQGEILELDYQIAQQRRVVGNNEELKKRNLIADQDYDEALDQYQYLMDTRDLRPVSIP